MNESDFFLIRQRDREMNESETERQTNIKVHHTDRQMMYIR